MVDAVNSPSLGGQAVDAGEAPGASSILSERCVSFVEALNALDAAEHALWDAVRPELETCRTVDDYQALIEKLPRRCRGVRRIYEAIERLGDK